MKYALVLAAIAVLLIWWGAPYGVEYATGRVITVAPVQVVTEAKPFRLKNYTLIPVSDFTVSARLLSKSTYHFDRESDLAPVDYALGWQSMAQPKILEDIDISQGGRFYHWSASDLPLAREDIETQSANMHLIPSTPEIEKQLKGLREGSLVRLHGYLVNIVADDGWTWNTSQSRADTGFGACEVIYVLDVMKGI